MGIVVDSRKCVRCALCQLICPEEAAHVSFSDVCPVEIDENKCIGCLECLDICQVEALEELQNGEKEL